MATTACCVRHLLCRLLLAAQKPETEADTDDEQDRHGRGPALYAAAQPDEIVAQLEDARFERFFAGERMEQVRVGLQSPPINGLKLSQLFRLAFAFIDRKFFVDEKVPDFLAPLAGVKRFVLSVADPAEFGIGFGWLSAVAIADDLQHALALIDLLAQHRTEVASFGAENVLPDRLITEIAEGVGRELPAAAQFAADGRDKNKWE